MKRQILFLFLLFALLFSACGAKSELARNRDKWQSQNVSHYRFHLNIGCFCAFRDRMPLTVEVQDGKILSMTDVDGQAVAADLSQYFNKAATVDGLFVVVTEALKTADQTQVEYDAKYGFPVSVQIDPIKNAMDDEISYFVTDFEVLP